MPAPFHRGLVAAFVAAVVLAVVVLDPGRAAALRLGPPSFVPRFVPPVDAPVTDPFRPPVTPYSPGNRGIEYGTEPGADVRAPAAGVVAFAGVVAGAGYVAVVHPGGLRSAVGPLASIHVSAGQSVAAGEHVGVAAGPTLFTVRRGGEYLDPAPLLVDDVVRVRLTADWDGAAGRSRSGAAPGSGSRLDPIAAAEVARWLRASRPPPTFVASFGSRSRRVPVGRPWPPGALGR